MRKIWLLISNLGVDDERRALYQRSLILNNQLNFSMLVIMLALTIFLSVMRAIENAPIGMGSIRILMVLALNAINLILAYYRKTRISKFLILFLPPVIIFIIPTLAGFVEQESFVYYPLAIIVFSSLPQLLMIQKEERTMLVTALLFYGLLLLSIEPFLEVFSPDSFQIIPMLNSFFLYSKVVQIVCFFFLQFAIYYLRKINRQYENEVLNKNRSLDKQNAELNRTLQQLSDTQQQLFQAEKMAALGTLTSGVAHEINNPLNFISGGLQVLDEEWRNFVAQNPLTATPDMETSIQIIREGVERTSKIVNALLSVSGNGGPAFELTDVQELIDTTLLFLKYKIPENVKVEMEYGLTGPIPLIRANFQQVVLNIIENALSAIESKSAKFGEFIRICTSMQTNSGGNQVARLEFINSGPAIPAKDISHIFEPFFTTKEAGKGTGLGLSIAYMFIKDHNGTISAENTTDGVCFRIIIPIKMRPEMNPSGQSK
jgi:signal transduction histidine kinase